MCRLPNRARREPDADPGLAASMRDARAMRVPKAGPAAAARGGREAFRLSSSGERRQHLAVRRVRVHGGGGACDRRAFTSGVRRIPDDETFRFSERP